MTTLRADRGVDRGAQLHLVVLAAALHAGAEIENRLLLLDRRQRLGERLQRAQPDVVVEHVDARRSSGARRSSVAAAAASSVATVAAAGGAGRGPVGEAERAERGSRPWRGPTVKSVSTLSIDLTVATATRSAGGHLLVDVLLRRTRPRAARPRAASS